jgi:hypothetical protein
MTPVETDQLNRLCKLHVTGVKIICRLHLELMHHLILIDMPYGQDQLHSGRQLSYLSRKRGS